MLALFSVYIFFISKNLHISGTFENFLPQKLQCLHIITNPNSHNLYFPPSHPYCTLLKLTDPLSSCYTSPKLTNHKNDKFLHKILILLFLFTNSSHLFQTVSRKYHSTTKFVVVKRNCTKLITKLLFLFC
jgi:hypothetical protein